MRYPEYENFDAACRYFKKRGGYSRDEVAEMVREGTVVLKAPSLNPRWGAGRPKSEGETNDR